MKLKSDAIIKTNRMLLREINETDADAIVSLRSNEEVYKYFCNPKKITVEEHKKWYRDSYCTDDSRIDWIAVDDKMGDVIGIYGLKKVSNEVAEVSYITNPCYYGKGFATEAVSSLIKWCKDNWRMKRMIAVVHEANNPSIAFAHSLGFRKSSSDYSQDGFYIMEISLVG